MVLENLTKKVQEIVVHEIVGDREYSMYIQPAGLLELDKSLVVVGLDSLKGRVVEYNPKRTPILHVEKEPVKEHLNNEALDTEETKESEDEEEEPDGDREPDTLPSAFICEICGAEFASERGLNSHMTRTHNKE